jgi:hypothetical protein
MRLPSLSRGRRVGLLGAIAVALVGVGVASGVAVAASTGHSGTSITRVAVTTQNAAAVFTSSTYTTVGTVGIFATAGQFVDARFTAESSCSGAGTGWCSVRILIDGVEAEPVSGTDFAFDDAGASTAFESHSVERVRSVTTSGTHTVTVQAASVLTALSFRLDDWTLTAMAVAA